MLQPVRCETGRQQNFLVPQHTLAATDTASRVAICSLGGRKELGGGQLAVEPRSDNKRHAHRSHAIRHRLLDGTIDKNSRSARCALQLVPPQLEPVRGGAHRDPADSTRGAESVALGRTESDLTVRPEHSEACRLHDHADSRAALDRSITAQR